MEHEKQQEGRKNGNIRVYKIFTVVEKQGSEKNIWLDIGVGRLNRDESITCKLDCLPLNGMLQIRPFDNRKNSSIVGNNLNSVRNNGGY